MSFFIAVKKSTSERLEMGIRRPNLKNGILKAFRAALCENYTITDSDLALLILNEDNEKAVSINDGAEFNLVWTDGELTDVDLSPELSKRILKISSTKSVILADNIDTTSIRFEIWKPNNSGIATNVNTTADLPIRTPEGVRTIRFNFVNGVCTKEFKTAKTGVWLFPAIKRIENLRVEAVVSIESIQLIEDL